MRLNFREMEQANKIKFSKTHPNAILPQRATPFSAGLDLAVIQSVRIDPHQRVACRTGLSVEIPPGFYGRIAPRSGLATKFGIDVLAGVVDSDYRGEVMCLLINHGETVVVFEAGDRIAQLIVERISSTSSEWTEALSDTERAEGGFGSSGR